MDIGIIALIAVLMVCATGIAAHIAIKRTGFPEAPLDPSGLKSAATAYRVALHVLTAASIFAAIPLLAALALMVRGDIPPGFNIPMPPKDVYQLLYLVFFLTLYAAYSLVAVVRYLFKYIRTNTCAE